MFRRNSAIRRTVFQPLGMGDGQDTLSFNAGVDGGLRISMGGGHDLARIGSTQVSGASLFRGDDGDDRCSVERTEYRAASVFRMGAGDDTLTIDTATPVVSSGPFGFNGDLGVDTLDRSAKVFGAALNFELLL